MAFVRRQLDRIGLGQKLSMGPSTHEIPLVLFELNRARLIKRLKVKSPADSVILLQGAQTIPINNTDCNHDFIQDSFFMWAFGVVEPACYGVIVLNTGTVFLFVPHLNVNQMIWLGSQNTADYYRKKYNLVHVFSVKNLGTILEDLDPQCILTLYGVNSDSGLPTKEVRFPGIEKFNVNKKLLYDEMVDLRMYKTEYELAVMKYVCEVSVDAHLKLMQMVRNSSMTEFQCETEFLHFIGSVAGCKSNGKRIFASGANTSILWYGRSGGQNIKPIVKGDLCLFESGARYFGYCSSVTCTFPSNGKFTPKQRIIYEAVLEASIYLKQTAKPHIGMNELHLSTIKKLLTQLHSEKIVQGNVDEMIAAGIGYIFMPHGIGNLIGLDVHDVGGYAQNQKRLTKPRGMETLRCIRQLEENMVISVQVGCYFIDVLLDEALIDPVMSKYLIRESIKRYRGFGGVCIQDELVITQNGNICLTEKLPRTVSDIESFLGGKAIYRVRI